jgi:LytR cell envelope-related transcriptional attenuator
MPAYVVYRPSVMRSGRLGVRIAAVAALLLAAIVAFVVVTRGGSHGSGAPSRAASATAGASAHTAQAKAVGTHAVTARVAKKAHVAKPPVKPVTHVKKKPKVHAAIPLPSTTPVAVLNGGTAQGAAAALAARLRAFGYPVPVVGNAGRRDLPMAIEYAAGLGPAARALARRVGRVQYVTPLEGPNRNLSGARLLVIVGT